MVERGGKKESKKAKDEAAANPEAERRSSLKKLALSKGILSETPASSAAGGSSSSLEPSKTVIKHHGKDILRKSQRKNRFLFSFPGLLAPISGGKIGELKDLGTKNPILYLDFPQGRMKLLGTIVYPKSRYLTLQFSRGGKAATCEDYFDNMIVFSDAWWIGRKEDNPEEAPFDLPEDMNVEHSEFDFKGGAGAISEIKQYGSKSEMKWTEQKSFEDDPGEDLSDSQDNMKQSAEVTPVRHSARTAGRSFNFAEPSSGDDVVENGTGTSIDEEEKIVVEHPARSCISNKKKSSTTLLFDVDNADAATETLASEHVTQIAKPTSKFKEISQSSHNPLVQATISTMFKKVEDKFSGSSRKVKMNEENQADAGPEAKTPKRRTKAANPVKVNKRKARSPISAASSMKKSKAQHSDLSDLGASSKVEEDDIEEFSSSSQDVDSDDDDWGA